MSTSAVPDRVPGVEAILVRVPTLLLGVLVAAAASWGIACSGALTPAAQPRAVRLRVFAAQSLTESFASIARAFEANHPGVTVETNLAGSSALATQIEQGAPADVFASADLPQMERVASKNLVGPAVVFAHNVPVVVVPADNRARIEAVTDLARPGVTLVLYPPDVPIGRYAREVLNNIGTQANDSSYATRVLGNLVSLEPNVRAALAKIEIGEADATIVYRTDAATSKAVRTIEIPERANVIADYPIAVVAASKERELAQAFVDFVRGEDGRRLLASAGFDAAR